MVAEKTEFAPVVLAKLFDWLATPADFPACRGQQAAQVAQQAGFARPVTPLQVQELARPQSKVEAGKQRLFAANAAEIGNFQHQSADSIKKVRAHSAWRNGF